MKRSLWILRYLLLLFFGTATTFGQGITAKGIKAGMTASTMIGKDAGGRYHGYNKDIAAGGFFTYGFGHFIAIQPELMFVNRGADERVSGIHYNQTISYLEMSALLKASVPMSRVVPGIYAGPTAGWMLEASRSGGGCLADTKCEYKKYDLGMTMGGGADFLMGFNWLTLEARYYLGLTKVLKNSGGTDIRNGVFSIMVGYAVK